MRERPRNDIPAIGLEGTTAAEANIVTVTC